MHAIANRIQVALIIFIRETLFQTGAYNFQSISAVGEKAVWPHETIQYQQGGNIQGQVDLQPRLTLGYSALSSY